MFRIFSTAALFASLLFFPWWVTACLALAAVILCENFYEVIAVAFVGDSLYGAHTALLFSIPLVFTAGAMLMFFAIRSIKKTVRFY